MENTTLNIFEKSRKTAEQKNVLTSTEMIDKKE